MIDNSQFEKDSHFDSIIDEYEEALQINKIFYKANKNNILSWIF